MHSKRDARDTPRVGHALGAGHGPGADVDASHFRAHITRQPPLEVPGQGHGHIPAAAGHIDDPQRPGPLDAPREVQDCRGKRRGGAGEGIDPGERIERVEVILIGQGRIVHQFRLPRRSN